MKTTRLLVVLGCLPGLAAAQATPAAKAARPTPPRSAQAAHQAVQARKASIGQKFVKHSKPSTLPDIPQSAPVQEPLK